MYGRNMENPLNLIQNRGIPHILVTLYEKGKLNVSQLSEKAGVCSGTLQRRLKDLKENNLLVEEIRESENSRLEKAYSLTDPGKELSKLLILIREFEDG
ncbi:hypothetical protein AKJ37_06235 [candidate division MSBL1 archaeon SCGC-AAA259I09]|uniref:HTH hxlR-type domain-containing protein n=1 Tax=candidate division MSBL1 archaeon SCGC-AAA259I09 TaxID=1698267 RepID=A0A133UP69_9EURY|nr:hypothetical protein AKJ37_06235 [candidate division MSBL1 archaeon SCGC-AAA259I09]